MRKILITTSLILCHLSILAQTRNTINNIKLIPQQRSNWCWAASIQMFDNYYKSYTGDSLLIQCKIVQKYVDSLKGVAQREYEQQLSISPNAKNLASRFPNKDIVYTCCADTCTNKVESKYGDITLVDMSFYPRVLNRERHNVKITNRLSMSWINYKWYIDNNHPLIFRGLDGRDIPGIWDGHAVVAIGYRETESLHLLQIHDPWEMCKGCTYYLNYDFIKTSTSNKKCLIDYRKSSFIHKKLTLPKAQNSNNLQTPHTKNTSISITELNVGDLGKSTFLQKEFGLQGNVNISPPKVIEHLLIEKLVSDKKFNSLENYFDTSIKHQIYTVRDEKNQEVQITTIGKRTCRDFFIESISSSCFLSKIHDSIMIAKDTFSLPKDYSIVLTKPLRYVFLKILYNGNTYLIPTNDYSTYLQKNTAYQSSEVLSLLKKEFTR